MSIERNGSSGLISSTVDAQLEGSGDPNFTFEKKCAYCSEQFKLTATEHEDHRRRCEQDFTDRASKRRALLPVEEEVREKMGNIEDIPVRQSNDFRGEQMAPWMQDSFIGIIVQNHMTRTESNIILPANFSDLSPELRDCLAVANVCRIVRVTDNFSVDANGNYLWPRLVEVKEAMESGAAQKGPLVKFMPGGGKPFPDSEGRACVLLQARYVYGEVEDEK